MWFKALELLGSLSILIVLHELGHFLTAKYFKVRVEKFYLFFDFMFPMPNVLNFSLFKKKIGDTEYGIGWFPMGGYVQMSGIMDESMDKEALKQPMKDYEFRAKPAWQRLIILLGGVIVNILLAMVIYSGMSYTWGDKYLPLENATYGISVDSIGRSIGLQNGDLITHVEGKKIEKFKDVKADMIFGLAKEITVKRGDKTFNIDNLNDEFYGSYLEKTKGAGLFSLRVPAMIGSFSEESTIQKAGAQEGDIIEWIEGKKIDSQMDVADAKKGLEGKEIAVILSRSGNLDTINMTLGKTATLGYKINNPEKTFKFERTEYTFVEAIIAGPVKTWKEFRNYLKQFNLIFNKKVKGYKQIGGFGAIGGMFPDQEDFTWEIFWKLTAFLSIMLAFLNLLPIPALDGGHALFTIYEMIARKPVNEKVMEGAQMIGMVLLFALLIYANGNDIFKLITGK